MALAVLRLSNLLYPQKRITIVRFSAVAFVFIVFLYLFIRVPILWDDWGRYGNSGTISSSWQFALSYYHGNSGRLFSSFVSILFLKHKIVWAIFGASILSLLVWVIPSISRKQSILSCLLVACLLVCSPLGLLSQTYTWICGFGYYMIPLPALVLYIYTQRNVFYDKPCKTTVMNTIVGFLLGGLTQLFIENASMVALFIGLSIITYSFIRHRFVTGAQIAFVVASIIGLIVMFSSPGYATLGQSEEWKNLSFLAKIVRQAPKLISLYVKTGLIPLALLTFLAIRHFMILRNRKEHMLNGFFWLLMLLFSASIMAVVPLAMASFFGARNFLYSYYFLIIMCVLLASEIQIQKQAITCIVSSLLVVTTLLWGCNLILIYRDAARTEKLRGQIVAQYKNSPTGTLYIPKINHQEYFWGANPSFHNNKDYHVIVFKKYWRLAQATNIEYINSK